ncbi:MAG: ribonuclease J [Bacteriovoracia bacterium]
MQKLKVVPLGGLGEIGLNCMVFEYDDEIIVVDCGVMFSDLQILGVDLMIPDMTYLQQNKDKISGYIITHGHEDHIGALPWALKSHPAPVYCSAFAQKLVESKLEEHGVKAEFKRLSPHKPVQFKHFTVTPTDVNHSIIEALALFIDTPVGKVVFTGDFKIDSNPYYGRPMDLAPFQKAGKDGVLLLMSDSTNVERDGHSISEEVIFAKFEELFQHKSGVVIVAIFASNIARIGQAMEIAHKIGKKVALLGRNMEQNVRLASELNYLKHAKSVLIPFEDIESVGRENVIVLSTGSQGEVRSALTRIANNEQKNLKVRDGDLIILSSKFIPGNEKAIGRMINNLFKLGADVLYESVSDIHVSGHANAEELREMLKATKPKFFIPVHGEYRHLVKHTRLSKKLGIGESLIAVNGDVIEVAKDKMERVDHFEENRILIEGEGGNDVSKVIIKDRRKVAETGIVFSVLIRNSVSRKIMAGPDLITRGFLEEGSNPQLLEGAKGLVLSILEDAEAASEHKNIDVQEEIRIGLRRYFNSRLGKKPVVMPIIVDV